MEQFLPRQLQNLIKQYIRTNLRVSNSKFSVVFLLTKFAGGHLQRVKFLDLLGNPLNDAFFMYILYGTRASTDVDEGSSAEVTDPAAGLLHFRVVRVL